jgi:Flp pilus assembly pilin Flp
MAIWYKIGNVDCEKASPMRELLKSLWKEESGQDMIEYALLAAAVVVAVAGVLPPTIMPSVSTIFSKVTSCFTAS